MTHGFLDPSAFSDLCVCVCVRVCSRLLAFPPLGWFAFVNVFFVHVLAFTPPLSHPPLRASEIY